MKDCLYQNEDGTCSKHSEYSYKEYCVEGPCPDEKKRAKGMDIKINKKPGDAVYWVKDGPKQWRIYKATIEAIHLCEYQGALYCELFCPEFKINPYPNVHYSFVFPTRTMAEDFRKNARKMHKEGIKPVCFGCNYAWTGRGF